MKVFSSGNHSLATPGLAGPGPHSLSSPLLQPMGLAERLSGVVLAQESHEGRIKSYLP